MFYDVVSEKTYNVSSWTLNPYRDGDFVLYISF